jgi:hypothetical protein
MYRGTCGPADVIMNTAVLRPAVRQRPFVVWSVFRIELSSLPRTRSTRPRSTADFLSTAQHLYLWSIRQGNWRHTCQNCRHISLRDPSLFHLIAHIFRHRIDRVKAGAKASSSSTHTTMPRLKRTRDEAELDLPEEPQIAPELQEKLTALRNQWEFASFMQYIQLFGSVVKIDDGFEIEVRVGSQGLPRRRRIFACR